MSVTPAVSAKEHRLPSWALALLRRPGTNEPLAEAPDGLISPSGARVPLTATGIPLFAEQAMSPEASAQQRHYDRVAKAYAANLGYPHTAEYMAYLDRALLEALEEPLGDCAEICCGRGEAIALLADRVVRTIGIDVSVAMLEEAARSRGGARAVFVQGDATMLPLASAGFDSVFMLGGIHHVNDRATLFSEVARILKPGGHFYFREPVDDFALWRWIRALVYRLSPALDSATERPLRHDETVAALERAGLRLTQWRTYGLLGFCVFMNSDVLIVNRLFRFLPGIRALTRAAARFDDWVLRLPGFARLGLQVVGVARKDRGTR